MRTVSPIGRIKKGISAYKWLARESSSLLKVLVLNGKEARFSIAFRLSDKEIAPGYNCLE
jgi:hypothetical protein